MLKQYTNQALCLHDLGQLRLQKLSNTKVTATTPAGSGANHSVVINVGAQGSTSAPTFSYKSPNITNVRTPTNLNCLTGTTGHKTKCTEPICTNRPTGPRREIPRRIQS